jgi:hypothetical protein
MLGLPGVPLLLQVPLAHACCHNCTVTHQLNRQCLNYIPRVACLCRYYLSWRNSCLNGVGLRDAAVAQLQSYAVPPSGSLKLDYVSYQVNALRKDAARL